MLNIRSKIAEKLLGYYFINLQARHYINELAQLLNVDPGNLDRKLKEFEKEGLFVSEIQGNLKYFSLNKKYPLYREVKKLCELNFGVEKKLAKCLEGVKGLKQAYIFGSFAKGKMSLESDIDILLVGSHSSLEAKRRLAKLEDEIRRELNVVDMTEKEFSKRKKTKDEFIGNIFKNKNIKII